MSAIFSPEILQAGAVKGLNELSENVVNNVPKTLFTLLPP